MTFSDDEVEERHSEIDNTKKVVQDDQKVTENVISPEHDVEKEDDEEDLPIDSLIADDEDQPINEMLVPPEEEKKKEILFMMGRIISSTIQQRRRCSPISPLSTSESMRFTISKVWLLPMQTICIINMEHILIMLLLFMIRKSLSLQRCLVAIKRAYETIVCKFRRRL